MLNKKNIKKYKELLITILNHSESHLYYFTYDTKPRQIKGFYVMFKDKFYLSVCSLSSICEEKIYEKLPCKYFDINNETQIQFFLVDKELLKNVNDENKDLLNIILCNKKIGTSRKFIIQEQDKINIQLPYNFNDNYFK